MQTYILITLVVIATIHLMMASVLFLYSRYKVQYLSLAWIMGIFGVLTCVSFPFMPLLKFANVGLLHPFMLLFIIRFFCIECKCKACAGNAVHAPFVAWFVPRQFATSASPM